MQSVVDKIQNYSPSSDAINLLERARVVLFCGITGAGKDRIQSELNSDQRFERIVTSTTRAPRENDGVMEQNGREYYFLSRQEAEDKIDNKEYFEVALVHGEINGVTIDEVRRIHEAEQVAIGDVDYQGVEYFKKYSPSTRAIFLIPPSYEVWLERLKKRYDSDEDFESAWPKRRDSAIRELEWLLATDLCTVVINDELKECVDTVVCLIEYGQTPEYDAWPIAETILDKLHQA